MRQVWNYRNNFYAGTAMMVGGGVLAVFPLAMKMPRSLAGSIGLLVAILGVIIQIRILRAERRSFKRMLDRIARREEEQEAFEKRLAGLPPEEADRLRVAKIDELLAEISQAEP